MSEPPSPTPRFESPLKMIETLNAPSDSPPLEIEELAKTTSIRVRKHRRVKKPKINNTEEETRNFNQHARRTRIRVAIDSSSGA